MKRRVLITGAAGDTGRAAVSESIKRGLNVRAMVRTKDKRSAALEALGAEVVVGDLLQIDSIVQAMKSVDAAYLVYPVHPGVIEATVNFAQAAKEAGVAAVVNLSQRSASRTSTSDSCRETWIWNRFSTGQACRSPTFGQLTSSNGCCIPGNCHC